jgi:hypothetical protein
MKKFGLLSLALVLVMGSLGIGYAAWTDTIFINGTVNTGSVCVEWWKVGDTDECPYGDPWVVGAGNGDYNLRLAALTGNPNDWPDPTHIAWPDNYFASRSDKDVACVTVNDGDLPTDTLLVTVHNGYPLYYADVEIHMLNCGTVPVILSGINIQAINFTLANYAWNPGDGPYPNGPWNDGEVFVAMSDGVGQLQLEPGDETAFSLIIIVQQSAAQNLGNSGGDPYQFLVTVDVTQWEEFEL